MATSISDLDELMRLEEIVYILRDKFLDARNRQHPSLFELYRDYQDAVRIFHNFRATVDANYDE